MAAEALPSQIVAFMKNLSSGRKVILIGLVGSMLAAFSFMALWTGTPELVPLYSGLAPEDAGVILGELKARKIEHGISPTGDSILVPREQVYETRMALASKGLPQGAGVGFEIFDNAKLGMTEFVQNVNFQRALQGEMARTINGFSEVEGSRVHIVLPSKSLFLEEEDAASASVVLKLVPGKWLSRRQVQGIVHLVSSSVSGLNPEKVTVVDNYGQMLAGASTENAGLDISSDQLEYQDKVERNLENRVSTMLEQALGPDKAIVRVSCEIDFKQYEKTEERYNPDNQVARSEQVLQTTSSGDTGYPKGPVGVVAGTVSRDNQGKTDQASPVFVKQDKTINYEIGKTTSRTVEPVGRVGKVSVAVIVDGTRTLVNEGKKNESWQYAPRSPKELATIEAIVKRTVNFDGARGDQVEVANIPFESPQAADPDAAMVSESWVQKNINFRSIVKYALMSVFLVLTFLFVVRPLVKWLTLAPVADAQLFGRLPKTVGELEQEYGRGTALPLRDRAMQAVIGDGEDSVQLLRTWLKDT